MAKSLLLGAALAASFLSVGFVAGRETANAPAAESACPVAAATPDDVLAQLNASVESLKAEHEKLGKRLQPAAALMEFLNERAPGIKTARTRANQTAAIATLRNFASAQAQFQASGKADQDQDGLGEYAGFIEMSGARGGRMSNPLVPPVLSRAFRVLNQHGEVSRSGYFFRIYLPSETGSGIAEPQAGFSRESGIDPDSAESTWCAYAWPADTSVSGARVFFTNQVGDILAVEDARYVGAGKGPKSDAAFVASDSIVGISANGSRGRDGNVWQQIN